MKIWLATLVCLLGVGMSACQPGPATEPGPRGEAPRPAPEFSLISQDNRAVSLFDLRGKIVLVDFIYTSCVDACPALQVVMDKVRRDLGQAFPDEVNLVTITFDPAYDTPQVMEEYASRAGWDVPGWYFLTGPQEETARVNDAYGSVYRKEESETTGDGDGSHTRSFLHNTLIILIDQQGMVRKRYPAPHLGSSAQIVEDVRALLR